MARLGAVLGGILAELARARAIADELTKDMLVEYESDPVLSSLSVPRVSLGEVDLTLRFTVEDLEEVPPAVVDAKDLSARLTKEKSVDTAFRQVLTGARLTTSEQAAIARVIGGSTGVKFGQLNTQVLNSAIKGNNAGAVSTIAKPVLDAFSRIPAGIRRKIGSKATFQRSLEQALNAQLSKAVDREMATTATRAVLASKIDVAIDRKTLPSDPGKIQEMRLVLRSEDLELVVAEAEKTPDDD